MGQHFGEDGATAPGEHGVDAPQDVGGGLDFARVHGEVDARRPVEEAGVDATTDGFDDFAGEAAHAIGCVFSGGDGDGDIFEEDSDALDGLGAKGALGCGELERVSYFVGEGVRSEGMGGACVFCCVWFC